MVQGTGNAKYVQPTRIMQLIYTIYGIKAISNDINGGYHTAVIFYMTYERMIIYSHNAAILNM